MKKNYNKKKEVISMFCQKCGGKLESYASNCAFCGAPVEKYDDKMKYVKVEKEEKAYKPMTAWKWIGLSLLPAVPFVIWAPQDRHPPLGQLASSKPIRE